MGGVSKPASREQAASACSSRSTCRRSVREDIAAWGETELADPALRRVPAESLHVTLAFLGNRPSGDVERIAEAMEGRRLGRC